MAYRNSTIKPSLGLLARYQALMSRFDAYVDANLARPLYNKDCAHELGMSERSLSAVVHAIRGMSVQRYIRIRRLTTVRAKLAAHASSCKVGDLARAHGFQHLGEFAFEYRKEFGELPSETARRAQDSSTTKRGSLPDPHKT
jgi:AraC-like DNA-binding protein